MPIDSFIQPEMNTSKFFQRVGMKYTRYLIYGNFFVSKLNYSENTYLSALVSLFDLIRTFSLLGLGSLLLPFALLLDTGRIFFYHHIRLSRRLRHVSFIYNLRKNTAGIFSLGSRFAYLIIRKTDSIFHF